MDKQTRDYYTILGLPRSATPDDIRYSWLKAAKRLHPDKNTSPGETEMFMEAQQAYQVLSNPARRTAYDLSLPPEIEIPSVVKKRILISRNTFSHVNEKQLVYLLMDLEPSEEYLQTVGFVPLNLCLVLDSSTSMKGPKLEIVKETAIRLIQKLKPQDIFSVVSFNDQAEVIIPATRQANPIKMENSIRHIQTSGGTEILRGLQTGLDEVNRYHNPKSINHIILLTDGRTYGDEQACYALAKEAAKRGIGLTGLGIGSGWNDVFLDHLASLTGGQSMLVPQPQDIERLLMENFSNLSRTFAENVNFEYKLDPGVEINYAFRLQPVTNLVHTQNPIYLGPILQTWPFSVLVEFVIHPHPDATEYITLIQGKLDISASNIDFPIPAIPINFILTKKESGELEPPPADIVQAISKLSLYRLQEKARNEAARGNYAGATEHLRRLATRLLSQGQNTLAKTVMLEIQNLETNNAYSENGEKQIKYGTRGLKSPQEIKP